MKTFLKLSFLLIAAVFFTISLFSDDGWVTSLSVDGGSIYSTTEHPDIMLEKEVLIFRTNKNKFFAHSLVDKAYCEAHFMFNNTSAKQNNIIAGFPVKISIGFREENGEYRLDEDAYGNITGYNLLQKIYGKKIFADDDAWNYRPINLKSLEIDKKITFDEYKKNFNDYVDFTIAQDDKNLSIDNVLIQAKISKNNKKQNDWDAAYYLTIHFHFIHNLSFKANSSSIVKASYSSITSIGGSAHASGESTSSYEWQYILGTGATWKDNIKVLYFVTPDFVKPILPKKFNLLGEFDNQNIYIAKDYEPETNDEIKINYINHIFYDYETEEILTIEKPKKEAQSFVTVKGSSSNLKDKTTVYTTSINYDENYVTLSPAMIKDIGFGALSLFDGIYESAWSEGAKGDGVNEWVEFELKEDVGGFTIQNGFTKIPYGENGDLYDKKFFETYNNNNRVKTLEFVSADGKTKQKVTLKDIREPQTFIDISLPKGVYKLYIREIYKGKKYADTCLGEIEFYPSNIVKVVKSDEFLEKTF